MFNLSYSLFYVVIEGLAAKRAVVILAKNEHGQNNSKFCM